MEAVKYCPTPSVDQQGLLETGAHAPARRFCHSPFAQVNMPVLHRRVRLLVVPPREFES